MTAPLNIFVAHPSHLLTDHLSHGDGLVAYGFIRELARRGHRLHVAIDRADLREELPPNIKLYTIPRRMRSTPLRRLEYMLRVRALLQELLRAGDIDLVHQFNPVYTGLSLAFVGISVPVVLGTYIAAWPVVAKGGVSAAKAAAVRIATRWIARLQQGRAQALLVTTQEALHERVATSLSRGRKVFFQQHGIDVDQFHCGDRRLAHAEQHILFVASVAAKKGIYILIEAMRTIVEKCPSARLIVAGGGPELERVEQFVRDAGLSACIKFLGNQRRDEVASLMRSSAVLCMPSFGEPYGMSVLEAFASGLPVVVTDAGGLPELVDADGGEKVAAGDASGLAAALVEILRSPARAEAMSRHNRARAESEFAWPRVVDTLEATYGAVVKDYWRETQFVPQGTLNVAYSDE